MGREKELSTLLTALDEARGGCGGTVLVAGEAGIGKTRLLAELSAQAAADGVHVAWGRCWEAGGAPAFWPWAEVLRGVPGATDVLTTAEAGSESARFAVFDAVGAELVAAARAAPLLVLLDDVHAADPSSLLLLEFVARTSVAARLLVVAAYREEDAVRAGSGAALARLRRVVQQVRLTGLDVEETASLLAERTGRRPDRKEVESVWQVTAGNPFFITEVAGLPSGSPPPAGVLHAVVSRMAPLPPELTDLLSIAAVGGRRLEPDVLAAVAGRDVVDVLALVDEGVGAGVLARDRRGTRFVHILVCDALVARLPVDRRLHLHAAFAQVLTRRHANELDEHLAELAHHHWASLPLGDRSAALRTARAAGERALSMAAYEAAAEQFERAVTLAADPPETMDLLLALGTAWDRAGAPEPAREAFERAHRLAGRQGDCERLARAVLGLTAKMAFQRADPAVVANLRDALADLDPGSLRVRLLSALARALVYTGQPAARIADQAVTEARTSMDRAVLADALHAQQVALWRPETLAARLVAADELVELTVDGDPDRAADARMWQLIAHLESCDIAGVDRAIEGYAEVAERSRRPRHRFVLITRRAMRAYLAGRIGDGDALAELARDAGLDSGEPDAEIVFHGLQVLPHRNAGRDLTAVEAAFRRFAAVHTSAGSRCLLALLALDRGAEAEAQAELTALAAAVSPDMDALLCWSLLAEVAARLGDREVGAELYAKLVPFAGRGAQIAGAVCFAGAVDHYLVMLARLLDRPADAVRHLADALRLHEAMGATAWAARTRAEQSWCVPVRTPDAREVMLRRDEGGWTVGAPGATFELPDSKGLRLLSRLLAEPGRELHVLDLDPRPIEPGTGPLLDEQAKAAYRSRVVELRAEIADARECADLVRAERAEAELDALTAELAVTVGLGGRDRTAGSSTERARVSVRKAVAAAVRRIAARDAELGLLLTGTVQTGTYCRYTPDPRWPVRWRL